MRYRLDFLPLLTRFLRSLRPVVSPSTCGRRVRPLIDQPGWYVRLHRRPQLILFVNPFGKGGCTARLHFLWLEFGLLLLEPRGRWPRPQLAPTYFLPPPDFVQSLILASLRDMTLRLDDIVYRSSSQRDARIASMLAPDPSAASSAPAT